jgi:hypothetical protein
MGEKRKAVVEKIKGNIDKWNVEIGKFRSRNYPARLIAQIQYQKQMKELNAKRQLIEGKITELQSLDEKALQGVKCGVDMAWKALAE